MRTGKMIGHKNNRNRYVPETIYLTGIPDLYQIEKICRVRIKEMSPLQL
jgi:hypothetical protein